MTKRKTEGLVGLKLFHEILEWNSKFSNLGFYWLIIWQIASVTATEPFRSFSTCYIWHQCFPWSIGNCPLLDTWNQFGCSPIHLHFKLEPHSAIPSLLYITNSIRGHVCVQRFILKSNYSLLSKPFLTTIMNTNSEIMPVTIATYQRSFWSGKCFVWVVLLLESL